MLQPNEGVTGQAVGPWVLYTDYLALQSALREALDGWHHWTGSRDENAQHNRKRIAELRKFLDDK